MTVAIAHHAVVARHDDFGFWNTRLLRIRDALLLGRRRHESADRDFQPLPVFQLTGLSSPDREARLIRETPVVKSSART